MSLCSFCRAAAAVPCPISGICKFIFTRVHYEYQFGPCRFEGSAGIETPIAGASHHASMDALNESAATCALCEVILGGMQENAARSKLACPWGRTEGLSFRLVARDDGVDGFMVLAKEGSWTAFEGSEIHIVAVVGFCRQQNDIDGPNSQLLRGTMAHDDAGLGESLDKARIWVRECINHHQSDCRRPKRRPPTRILDLDELWHQQRVRLRESSDSMRDGDYVALSYRWGGDATHDARHLKTTTDTLLKHMAGILVDEMPKTFRDAIQVTRHLGIRYLWIDSLCICQDDNDDWVHESATMADVYSGAYVVIAADSANHPSAGFLQRPKRTHTPVALATPDGGNLNAMAYVTNPQLTQSPNFRVLMPWEPLSQRGWTLQERVLAPRVLHFGAEQMLFECNSHFISEDGFSMPGRWGSVHSDPGASEGRVFHALGYGGYDKAWQRIVDAYSQRELTVRTDKLPAIAGLAQSFHERFLKQLGKTEYLAGLWSHSIIDGLQWRTQWWRIQSDELPSEVPLASEPDYIAPSWSWATARGPHEFWAGVGRYKDLAAATAWHITPKNQNAPMGEVVDGWIQLRGPLFPLTVGDGDGWESNLSRSDSKAAEESQFGHRFILDHCQTSHAGIKSWLQAKDLFGLAIAKTPRPRRSDGVVFYNALLLEARGVADGGLTRYTRLGGMRIRSDEPSEHLDRIEDPSSVTEVLLV